MFDKEEIFFQCHTFSVRLSNIHELSLPTCCTTFIYLFTAPTCFGHSTGPSSLSYKLLRHIQHILQIVIRKWQKCTHWCVYIYIYIYIKLHTKSKLCCQTIIRYNVKTCIKIIILISNK
jgi:hypothetical protein